MARHNRPLPHVVFELNDDRMPLTWNLGKAAPLQLETAWNKQENQDQLEILRDHLNSQVTPCLNWYTVNALARTIRSPDRDAGVDAGVSRHAGASSARSSRPA